MYGLLTFLTCTDSNFDMFLGAFWDGLHVSLSFPLTRKHVLLRTLTLKLHNPSLAKF
jgi:hypothetical protein